VFQTPYVVYSAVASIRGEMEATAGALLLLNVALLLVTLKSAVNFIIYCWFSEKFRATLKRVFRCIGGGSGGMNVVGGNGGCCYGRCCYRYIGNSAGNGRRRDTYCSVKMQTSAIQLTAI
jgi:hypothetical protein